MKTPLRFQATEYDCGTTSLINAISYLFEREEIPAEIIKEITISTLDEFDEAGNKAGTSRYAMNMITHWITSFSKVRNFNLRCERLEGSQVTLEKMIHCVKNNGVVLARLYQESEHYVIITDIDDNYVYLFDPYYLDENYYDEDREVIIIFNQLFKYNRRVSIDRFLSEGKKDFALGSESYRECVLMYRRR